jgi:hypothetical protein
LHAKRWKFVVGGLLAGLPLLLLAEAFLRCFPPKDLHRYLGETAPISGVLQPDDDFGVAYRSWDDFVADNTPAMTTWLATATSDPRPVWAMFGNSFVQAEGMLADTTRAHVADRRVFNLGRNEDLWVRFAQIRLLLEHGLAPERLFIELMPTDTVAVGVQPLDTLLVNSQGGLTFKTSHPGGPASWLIDHSRLALTAWVRSGWHKGNPSFNPKTLYEGVPDRLRADLGHLFTALHRTAQTHQVPVTVILIPSYHQVVRGSSWRFQNDLTDLFTSLGLDVFDPRQAFCRHADPRQLYIPDLHLSAEGNRLLLDELLSHIRHPGPLAHAAETDRP